MGHVQTVDRAPESASVPLRLPVPEIGADLRVARVAGWTSCLPLTLLQRPAHLSVCYATVFASGGARSVWTPAPSRDEGR